MLRVRNYFFLSALLLSPHSYSSPYTDLCNGTSSGSSGPVGNISVINATTDQVDSILTEGMNISLASNNISIKADVIATVGSIRFIDNGTSVRVESAAPYSIAGDGVGPNYNPWPGATVGSHTLQVVAYSKSGASGTILGSKTIKYTIGGAISPTLPPTTGLTVSSFVLVNSTTDLEIKPLANCDVIDLATISGGKVSLRANTSGTTGSVRFFSNGTLIRNENAAPYTIAGDAVNTNGTINYNPWTGAVVGEYEWEVKPYSSANGGGTQGATKKVVVKIVSGTTTPPTPPTPPTGLGTPISLTRDMLMTEAVQEGGRLLIDGDINTFWSISNPWLQPFQHAIIDLGAEHNLTGVEYYRKDMFSNTGTITIAHCRKKTFAEANAENQKTNPLNCTSIVSETLSGSKAWVPKPTNVQTRYVRISLTGKPWASEIKLYGTRTGNFDTVSTVTPPNYPLFDQFMGVNAFVDDQPTMLAPVAGHVRDYANKSWFTGGDVNPTRPDGFLLDASLAFEPAVGGFRFDRFYTGLRTNNVTIIPTLKESLRGGFNSSRDSLCVPGYSDTGGPESPYDPYSYRSCAELFYQYVARYGSKTHPAVNLKLKAGQPVNSGMNLLNEVEAENEQDKTWKGLKAWHHVYMDSAYHSALYDGHLNTIGAAVGNRVGVKNADPNFKLSLGAIYKVSSMHGIADLAIERLKLYKLWWDVYRNGSPFFNIVNLHEYARNDANTVGIPPEEHKFKDFAKSVVDYSKKNLGDMPVYITEFGYDTHPESVQRAPAYGNFTAFEVQAMWNMRTLLEFSASGIQKATIYMIRDAGGTSTKYSSSGLVGRKEDAYSPTKDSYYYLATLKEVLSGTRFVREEQTTNPNLRYYVYQGNGKDISVIWMGTSNGSLATIPVPAGTLVEFNATMSGVRSAFPGGTLSISEKPVIIIH